MCVFQVIFAVPSQSRSALLDIFLAHAADSDHATLFHLRQQSEYIRLIFSCRVDDFRSPQRPSSKSSLVFLHSFALPALSLPRTLAVNNRTVGEISARRDDHADKSLRTWSIQ